MKRYSRAAIIVLFLGFLCSCSQREANLETLIMHVRNDYRSEHFSISPSVAAIFIDETLPGGSELKALLEGLTYMEVIVIPVANDTKGNGPDKLFNGVNKRLDRQELTHLGEFRSVKETVDVWAVKNRDVTDLVVINQTKEYLYFVHFKGEIAENKISGLMHPKNRPILDYLYRLKPS